MLQLSKEDVEYLRPSPDAENIYHSSDYIRRGSGYNSRRAIYYDVKLDAFELEHLRQLQNLLVTSELGLNSTWNDRELLKYLYSTKFDVNKAFELLAECLQWRAEARNIPITAEMLDLLGDGALYPFGRDRQHRPIIIINMERMNVESISKNKIGLLFTFVLDSVKQFSLLQGKIENIILIIDAAEKQTNRSLLEKLEFLLNKVSACYPQMLEKAYILNAGHSTKIVLNLLQTLFDKEAVSKVQFLSKTDVKKLQSNINQSHIEKIYGGGSPNLSTFWPFSDIFGQLKRRLSSSRRMSYQNKERHIFTGASNNIIFSEAVNSSSQKVKIFEGRSAAVPTTVMVSPERITTSPEYYNLDQRKTITRTSLHTNLEDDFDSNNENLKKLSVTENHRLKTTSQGSPEVNRSSYKPGGYVVSKKDYQMLESQDFGKNYVVEREYSPVIEEWPKQKFRKPIAFHSEEEDSDDERLKGFCGFYNIFGSTKPTKSKN